MSQQTKRLYEFGRFSLDVSECRLLRDGLCLPLKPKALETLILLVENNGHMLEKEELMQRLWPDSFVEEANLAVNISQLRKVLRANGEQYIETIPKHGYRFTAEVRTVVAPADLIVREYTRAHVIINESETENTEEIYQGVQATELTRKAQLGSSGSLGTWLNVRASANTLASTILRNKVLTVLAAMLFLAVPIAYLYNSWLANPSGTPAKPRSLAILPFRNLKPDAETDFLGPSLSDAITSKLGHVRALIVRPSSYVGKYGNQEVDPRAAANELNVDTLLTGSYLKDGEDIRITTQLIDVSKGEVLWRDTIDVKYEKVLSVQDRVANEVIHGLRLNISPAETERLTLDAPQDPFAYENFLRGRYLISTNDHPTAIKMLEESVELDPNYALAWAYLGKAYSVTASQYFGGRKFSDKAKAAYDKALALNPQQLETRVLLANFLTENNRVEEAVPILRQVLEENPNHPFARWELSYAYRYAGIINESISEGESALRLYPQLTGHLFNTYLYAGRYEEFLNSLPMRDDAYTLYYRGLGNYYLKDWSRAAFCFDRAYQLDPTAMVAQIGRALRLGIAGNNREGLEMLKAVEGKIEGDRGGDGELSYKVAQAYAALGEKSSARRHFRRSIEQGFFCYPYFANDPLLLTIRNGGESGLLEQARRRHEEFKRKFF